MEPRATPDARFGLGAAFLRAVRLIFLRSALSVMDFVFILFECSILLDSCVLFHQLLQTVAGKAYRELSILAIAFATQHGSAAIFGMPDHGAGAEAAGAAHHGGPGLGIGDWGRGRWLVAGGWWRSRCFAALREELLDVVDGVVCFAGISIALGGFTY